MSSSFAQGIYFAQRRTHDGRVRGIASAIPGRHPRGAHVEIVRLVFFLLGEMTPASFARHVGVRLGRLAHGVRRERSRAARRLHSGPEQRARPPPFSLVGTLRARSNLFGLQCIQRRARSARNGL